MRLGKLMLIGLLTAACSGSTDGVAPTEQAPIAAGGLSLTEISLGEAAMVVITNLGQEPVSLSGHFLCQRPSYAALPDVDLAPGEALAIGAGGSRFSPPSDAKVAEDPISIGGLSPGGGEVGLYSSSDFGDPAAIVGYVEWGNAGHGRSDVAVEAGIWGGFVPTTGSTSSLAANTEPPTSASHWDAVDG